ncbi:uncharacterized protein LOC135206367 [Macrobrachium nipponense]|uniref:uncharacterized protein LOC135206367 n=1 Tax=Macrobrachium nipponense TaxID=159736 RepID=UPI0030C8831A
MIPVEAWKALGDEGVDIRYDLMIKILEQEKVPHEWRGSMSIPIFKGKGDVQEYGSYRGIKSMSHTLKILERMIDARLRDEIQIGKKQMGFMRGRGTADGIFCLRQLMEKFREKQREIHMIFIELEKVYDQVPSQEVWRSLREKMVPEKEQGRSGNEIGKMETSTGGERNENK